MLNSVKKLTSQLNSAVLSNTGGIDATQTTDIVTADSKAVSAATRASSVSTSAATAITAVDTKAESASTRASSVSLSAATGTATADSKAVSAATGMLTQNLNKKNVYSASDSDTAASLSTTGDFAVGGVLYTKTASSAVFTLAGTTLTSSQACMFLLALDSAGSGQVTQGNIAATSGACSLPATPANQCPVGQLVVVAGASTFVPGTTTFSQCVSNTGSVVMTDLMRRA